MAMTMEDHTSLRPNFTPFGRKRRIDRQKILALNAQGIGATAIARQLGIGRSTVYLILKEFENLTEKAFQAKP
jgi:DNA invertase Pin-like site-specific DNA recombinase